MFDQIIRDLADDGRQPALDDKQSVLAAIVKHLGLQNASYLAINLQQRTHREFYVQNTFRDGWPEHYEQQGYVDIDPLVQDGLTRLMPMDWGELKNLTAVQHRLFGEAAEFRVGTQGLTFPLIGPNGERAVLSFTSELPKREWEDFRRERLADMRLMASLFHRSVMNGLSGKTPDAGVTLTARERECLLWCAEGKTQDETARILGISARTVRFFLDNARHKLDCQNMAQTVVCAMQRGLI